MTATHPIHTRWPVQRDRPGMAALDGAWTADDFRAVLRRRECIGLVAERGDAVCGFAIYELHPEMLRVIRFAAADVGACSALVNKLLSKLGSHRRHWLELGFAVAARMGGVELAPQTCQSLPDVTRDAGDVIFADLPAIPAAWRSDNVRWMCAGERYPCLPVLADALEEAGCDCAELLGLFRADGDVAGLVYEELREALAGRAFAGTGCRADGGDAIPW